MRDLFRLSSYLISTGSPTRNLGMMHNASGPRGCLDARDEVVYSLIDSEGNGFTSAADSYAPTGCGVLSRRRNRLALNPSRRSPVRHSSFCRKVPTASQSYSAHHLFNSLRTV